MQTQLKTKYYNNEIIAGDIPDVPNTHVLLRDEADGEYIHTCYYLVPKILWEQFIAIKKALYEEAQLVYQRKEYFAAACELTRAEETINQYDFRLPFERPQKECLHTFNVEGCIEEDEYVQLSRV